MLLCENDFSQQLSAHVDVLVDGGRAAGFFFQPLFSILVLQEPAGAETAFDGFLGLGLVIMREPAGL